MILHNEMSNSFPW